ncbi:hypothetical protein VPH35_006470 [Triticum aestivum]|uniref:Uncharacterized protein n=1 Tax=Triticum turgidum subsp. durum TaxID=4567 RepID=A0A9R0V5G2_TRITD|nr:unnamed protein product [Triticum turgidum subsp. durum]
MTKIYPGESLNISYLSPYLKALGSNYSNGVNFAISGSTTLPRDALFVLHGQVQEFFFFKARSSLYKKKNETKENISNLKIDSAMMIVTTLMSANDAAIHPHFQFQFLFQSPQPSARLMVYPPVDRGLCLRFLASFFGYQ